MIRFDVDLKVVNSSGASEFSDTFYRNCTFCEKLIKITANNFQSCNNIGGSKYCPFCLRHNFHEANSCNVLVFSFRGIAGYYYYRLYRNAVPKLWLSQIENYLEAHALVGLQNPTLTYDPHALLWFANFNKIGSGSKAPFDEVIQTIRSCFDCFQLKKHIPFAETPLWERFEKAIKLFHEQRNRPKNKKLLIPTLSQITQDSEILYEDTRNFTRAELAVK